MKLLITGDHHNNQFKEYAKLTEHGYNSRFQNCLKVYHVIQKIAEKYKVDAILNAGDLFNSRKKIDSIVYRKVFNRTKKLAKKFPIYIIPGNHDFYLLDSESSLLPFNSIKNCSVIEHPKLITIGSTSIMFVPYVDNPEELMNVLNSAPKADLMIGHFAISGAKAAKTLMPLKFDVNLKDSDTLQKYKKIFLGHFHNYQKLYKNIYYIGSPQQFNWGDCNDDKYLLLYNTETDKVTKINITNHFPRFKEFILTEETASKYSSWKEGCREDDYIRVINKINNISEVKKTIKDNVPIIHDIDEVLESRIEIPEKKDIYTLLSVYAKHVANDEEYDLDKLVECGSSIVTTAMENNKDKYDSKIQSLSKFKFTRLCFKNFFSFQDLVSIDLNARGIIKIEGNNKDSNGGDNNGSGKSIIAEAFCYALFGSPLRKIPLDQVINSKVNKDMYVSIEFSDGKNKYKIKRYRKHSKYKNKTLLFCNDKNITSIDVQYQIETHLGVSKNVFIYTVLNSPSLVQGITQMNTDSDRKCILEDIFNLNEYNFNDLLQTCKTVKKDNYSKIEKFINRYKKYETSISNKKESLEKYKKKEKYFKKEYSEKEKEVTLKIESLNKDLMGKKTSIKKCTKELSDLKFELNNLIIDDDTSNTKIKLSKINTELTELSSSIKAKEKEIVKISTQINITKTLSADNCETCGNVVTDKVKKQINSKRKLEIKDIESSITVLNKNKSSLESKKKSLEKEIDNAFKKIQKHKEKKYDLKATISTKESAISNYNSSVEDLKDRIEELTNSLKDFKKMGSEFTGLKKQVKLDIQNLKEKYKKYKSKSTKYGLLQEYYNFWETGFSNKGLKSYMFDSLLPTLNKNIKMYLNKLTQGAIKFTISSQTKIGSGALRDKFSYKVETDGGALSYGGLSKGQKARIDCAITLALNSITREVYNFNTGILLLDEITDGLDEEGIDRVARIIQELSNTIGTIFVMTHDQGLKDYFDNVTTVIYKDKVSSIEKYL